MEIILLERVEKLGKMGDVVRVKDGYARNFLLPQKKALRANAESRERFERERDALERLNDERRTAAAAEAEVLTDERVVLIRQASDTLQLYGSVSARDVADAVSEGGLAVKRQQVRLDRPIKSLGIHDVRIALHPEVTITVKVNVARSPEEAEIQARGGTILAPGEEEPTPEALAAEAEAAFRAEGQSDDGDDTGSPVGESAEEPAEGGASDAESEQPPT